MVFSKKQAIMLVGGGLILVVVIIVVLVNLRGSENDLPKVNLLVWGFDDRRYFESVTRGYAKLNPNVLITYQQVSEEGYEERLLEALALDQGPDIFPVKNHSLLRHRSKLAPVPVTQFTISALESSFPQVVEHDFVSEGRIYALPWFLDTLALFYNRDLFDRASIVFPPETWQVFQEDVLALVNFDSQGKVLRAGAGIGGSVKTVHRAADLLGLLMLQNGTKMVDTQGARATFAAEGRRGPGLQALNFYLQFANVASKYYTWSDSLLNDFDSFAQGKSAMAFGYYSDLLSMKKKNPFLNAGIARIPQAEGRDTDVDYADYIGFGVSRKNKFPAWAWDFIIYATTKSEVQEAYFRQLPRPPALRSVIEKLIDDAEFGVFTRGALTARSWTRVDGDAVNQIFSDAIASVLTGVTDSEKALSQAQEKVTQVLKLKQ